MVTEYELTRKTLVASDNYGPVTKKETVKAGADHVAGKIMAREKANVITSKAGEFVFILNVDDKLDMAINGGTQQTVTFGAGVNSAEKTASQINNIFAGLAGVEGAKIVLKALTSIDIKATSTSLTKLGLTAGVYNETNKMIPYSGSATNSSRIPVCVIMEEALALSSDVEAVCGYAGVYKESSITGLDSGGKEALEAKGIYFN